MANLGQRQAQRTASLRLCCGEPGGPVSRAAHRLCEWGSLFAAGRASCSLSLMGNTIWLNLDLFTSLPYSASTPVSTLHHAANSYETSFQGESGVHVTSSSNNWCPSGRDPEISWGQLVQKSERPGSQCKYCSTIQILQTDFLWVRVF